MDIEASRNFINDHKDQVIDLFLTYQMAEMLLFFKLHLPDLPGAIDREDFLEEANKKINSKTFGQLRNKYLEKFPNDEYNLIQDLKIVAEQRNSFMHSLWMVIALSDGKEDIGQIGEVLLNDFVKQSHALLEKIYKLPN